MHLMTVILAAVFTIVSVPEEVQQRMYGVSYPKESTVGLPAMQDLRYLRMSYWDFDGNEQLGEMVCHKSIAQDLVQIFRELYNAGYRIKSMRLVDDYNGSDDASMADDNTSCFNFRPAVGSKKLSSHALGVAVDINPIENPYVKGDKVLPPAGKSYLNRSLSEQMIYPGDLCLALFKAHGFEWGGDWNSLKDYQHFEKRPDNL